MSSTAKEIIEVDNLVRSLGSRRKPVREAAELALTVLTDPQVDALVLISRRGVNHVRFRLVAGLVLFLVAYNVTVTHWSSIPAIGQWLLLLSLPLAYIVLLRAISNSGRQNLIAHAITFPTSMKLLGPLLGKSARVSRDSARWRIIFSRLMGISPDQHEPIVQAILRIIPEVKSDLYMNAGERQMLLLVLRSPNVRFVSGLLHLLETIGDTRELPNVRAIAAGQYAGATDPELRELAARCCAAIETRLAGEKITGNLLRASQPTASEELLQPAGDSVLTSESDLLHPSENNSA